VRAEEEFFQSCARAAAQGDYSRAAGPAHPQRLPATTWPPSPAPQTDRMTRDDGWRLLSIGRHVERLGFLATALAQWL